ncbi:MAG: hypothetical protein APR54_07035 [Candidatus Cloacimonas sp. SDB]|nr:MAG: hypothetical protein APR54_07035 [Candidatus Cloacimonas sp. SDB]
MKIHSLPKLKEILLNTLEQGSETGIVTHENPDGDGIGAALALQEILLTLNLKSDIILEEKIPEVYRFLNAESRTIVYDKDLSYKTLIVLDCHEHERLGSCEPLITKAENIIVIDHHIENNVIESDYFIDSAKVAVGAIIFLLFQEEIFQMNKKSALYVAEAVYLSIINDTDNFINSNVDEETFQVCAQLMELGLDPGSITKLFLLNKTPAEMRYVGGILNTIKEFCHGKVVFLNSTSKMLEQNKLDAKADYKILRWVKGMKNVEVVGYFSETSSGKYKLSLRSVSVNVNIIAGKFGGGGHKKASGCSLEGNLAEVEELVLTEIKKQLK